MDIIGNAAEDYRKGRTMTTTSLGTSLRLRKITARIGAEVTGLSPDLDLDPDTVAAVRAALNEHKALVFRGVDLDDAGQQRFAGYFGELTTAHPTIPAVDQAPRVLAVDSQDGPVNHWHTDVTFVLNPPQASTLRSIVVPPYGGETLIANTAAGPVRRRVPRRPAPAAVLRDPAGERAAGDVGATPASAVRQPDHPALRDRQLRRRPAPPAPGHRGR
jgi:hypothetical protein